MSSSRLVPERQRLLDHPDIAGVRVGVAEDPGGPVTAAPGVPLLELLDQRHRPPRRANHHAVADPIAPAPTTTTSTCCAMRPSLPLTQDGLHVADRTGALP